MALTRAGRKPIQDEFTDLPISTSRKWQLRQLRDGKCIKCPEVRCEASSTLCLKHWQLIEDTKDKRRQDKYNKRVEQFLIVEKTPIHKSEIERRANLTIPLPRIGQRRIFSNRSKHGTMYKNNGENT